MPCINFIGVGEIDVSEETTVLEAAWQLGIVIESPCNGAGVCGKCNVQLSGDSQSKEETYVLACETHVLEDMSVFPPEKEKNYTLKILSGGKSFDIELNPNVKKQHLSEKSVTEVRAGEEILCTEPGNTAEKNLGLSLDIGTTTLVLSLIDLNDGREIDSVSAMNPQAVYAQDVLSRIKFASSEEGLETMRSALITEVNKMLEILEQRSNKSKENIYEAIFSGNTCMLHLAAGVQPAALGKYPYTSAIEGISTLKAVDMGLNISNAGVVYLPPCISAYVGADITSGILASSLFELNGVTLFVDIGTNGEMVIGANGKLCAASTAAGPAFEGMNIAKGMRAGNGAVEEFEIADGEIRIKVIGNTKAVGICGSGLIDIVGELVFHNVISKSGKFSDAAQLPPFLAERLIEQDGKKVFQVEGDVVLTQKDIRQVQLAKGAIRAGIEYLLRAKNTPPEQVDRVLIAGSFGYHLRAKSLININLMPKEFEGKIEFVGNTSSSGGIAFLLGKQYRAKMEKKIKEIEVLELANMPDFEKLFVKTLNF
ncbi:MAG: ASKHA domain-containing protein [Fibromonadaceae bacterium]|nr:ASKHA domain-containing protein [Fibromonadaceae bacterium]